MNRVIRRYAADECGATAIEYALICAIIGTALIGIASTGGAVAGLYDRMLKIAVALAGGGGGDDGGGSGGGS